MASTLLTMLSNKPGASTLTLVSGTTDTGYGLLLDETNFGDAVWDVQFSGQRGTQGARAASSTPQNRPLVLSIEVQGTSRDNLASRLSTLYATVDEFRRFGGRVTFRAEGQTYRQHFDVMAGSAQAKTWDKAAEFGQLVNVVCSFSCAPYLLGDPMEITDDFSSDTLANYTFDGGASSNVAVTGGVLDSVNNLTTENRAVHTAYGYDYGDNQATLKFTPGSTITSFKAGVVLKRTAATTYLEVYVDDNGTNSRLRLDKVVAGVRTNLSSTNLAARVSNGTAGWVRGRIEGNIVYLEYFTSAPSPTGTPTLSANSTLTGGDITAFGSAVTGKSGWSWTPQQTAATLDDFKIEPYTFRALTLPQTTALSGSIPGDAPALADVTVSQGTGTGPVFGLIGWYCTPSTSTLSIPAPLGIIEAETGTSLANWASTADANYRGGTGLKFTTTGSASAANASFSVDPSVLTPDDHTQGEIEIELWGRFELASTLSSPTLTASLVAGLNTRYTSEWGINGLNVVKPSSGTVFRFIRLGTIVAPIERTRPYAWQFTILAEWGASGSGQFGFDYLVLVPAKSRALSPTAKTIGATYPSFMSDTKGDKTIRSDLSALYAPTVGGTQYPDQGLGGSLIELPTGNASVLVKLSSLVPDDPTAAADSEALAHTATVKVAPTPRYHFLRAS